MNKKIITYKRAAQTLAQRKEVKVTATPRSRKRITMNFSQSSWIGNESECKNFFLKSVCLRYPSADSFYGLLVAAAVLNLAACPFTILLNALVMFAVKTKRRLQTHPNILLACLALTDLMVGLVLQPLHITKTIFLLQGKDAHQFCNIESAFTVSFVIFTFPTACHLLLISGERYLAIKHTFTHATVVTKARLIISSAVVWIAAIVFLLVVSYLTIAIFISFATIISSIALLQFFVYKEARRHEKQILLQQVSLEARAKFKQEKKALKLTTIILVTIFLCFFLPFIFMFVTWDIFSETFSPDVKTLVRHLGLVLPITNSVLNPVIYTVRKRQFRIAFIELLLRKSLQEAEEFGGRLFGSPNNTVRQNGQEGEVWEQNHKKRNAVNANDNLENNPEVLVSGANFDDQNNTATQNESPSSNALNSTSKKTMEVCGEGKTPAHDINKEEGNLEALVPGPSFDWKNADTVQNKNVSSNELDTTKMTEKEPQHRVGTEKAGLEIKIVEENIARNRSDDDIEPISPKIGPRSEIATQPEFEETSF